MAGEWIQKVWGRTRPLVLEDSLHIFECEAVAGGYCSIHRHTNKSNTFLLLSGEIAVSTFSVLPSQPGAPVLVFRAAISRENEATCIPAGILHRFYADSSSRFLEIYRPRVDVTDPSKPAFLGSLSVDDIERLTLGGMKP